MRSLSLSPSLQTAPTPDPSPYPHRRRYLTTAQRRRRVQARVHPVVYFLAISLAGSGLGAHLPESLRHAQAWISGERESREHFRLLSGAGASAVGIHRESGGKHSEAFAKERGRSVAEPAGYRRGWQFGFPADTPENQALYPQTASKTRMRFSQPAFYGAVFTGCGRVVGAGEGLALCAGATLFRQLWNY